MIHAPTCGSVFSGGVGGLDIAASLAGFDIRFHVEYDDWRRKVLEKHAPQLWPNSKQYKDIETLETASLPRPDVLFGGFPCQDVSLAGKRAGLGKGTRSGLWFHFRRLISDLRPRAVVVENTPGLLSMGGCTVVGDLTKMGYVGRWGVISAADACAPHLRDRVFIVAYALENRQSGTQSQPRQGADSEERINPLYQPAHSQQRNNNASEVITSSSICRTNESASALADADEGRFAQPSNIEHGTREIQQRRYPAGRSTQTGHHRRDESRLGRAAYGAAARLHFPGYPAYQNQSQHRYEPPRLVPPRTTPDWTRRVEALGDAVVWLQAFPIFYYLYEVMAS